MEVVIIILLPVLFLVLAASMLVVSQLSGFFQFGRYSGRRQRDKQAMEANLMKLAYAQNQVVKRSKEIEAMSDRLKDSNLQLESLNSMKSKFLSMAVHDMRTPLASIKGFGEMLSRQELEGSQKKYVDYIVRGTDQINRLMGDLTDLAVIEAGKLKMEKTPFMLSDMVKDIIGPIGMRAEKAGLEFIPPELDRDVEVVGDKFRLVQALNNFLGNAIKFTPKGGKVELKIKAVGRAVTFFVKDSGPGVHPTERRALFDKFYQSKFQDAKDRKKGWGLGLAITMEIINAHFGELGVESAGLGKGATFWFKIPMKPPRAAMKMLKTAALLLAVLPAFAGLSRAQEIIPLEEKAKFEKALEEKAGSVLLQIVGPTRYKVVVDATLDFTRIEKFDVKSGALADKQKAALFLWQNIGAESSAFPELLPGIPSPESVVPGLGGNQTYERQNSFPASFVKRLKVTVVVDETVEVATRDLIARIIPEILDMTPARGDVLEVVSAPFAPAWETIWYQPEAVSMLFKYGLIGIMTLVTLLVVAACFLKLAEAMDSMAQAQAHQLQMDFGQDKEGEKEGKKEGEKAGEEEGAAPKVFFEVKLGQVETLWEIMQHQDPENIALITAHLESDVKKKFLSRLPADMRTQVLMNLGKIRFVEPDVVATVKEELERRLESAVGGRGDLIQMVQDTDLRGKRNLLRLLEEREPELARVVRGMVVLFEDLVALEPREWSILLGDVPLEMWSNALYGADEAISHAVQNQMLPKTWAILTQMMDATKPTETASDSAREKVVDIVERLVEAGRIAKPEPRQAEPIAAETEVVLDDMPALEQAPAETT